MRSKLLYLSIISLALAAAGCHAQKAPGVKQRVGKDVPVPATTIQQQDTTHRTPTPQYTPNTITLPNTRPKPVPDPKVPVPPL